MTTDNNTGKSKEFYERGRQMFDRIKPLNERSQTKPSSKRTWVGLTDEERKEIMHYEKDFWGVSGWEWKCMEAIEAKLKEKNT